MSEINKLLIRSNIIRIFGSKSIDDSTLHLEFNYRHQIVMTIQMSSNYYNYLIERFIN